MKFFRLMKKSKNRREIKRKKATQNTAISGSNKNEAFPGLHTI